MFSLRVHSTVLKLGAYSKHEEIIILSTWRDFELKQGLYTEPNAAFQTISADRSCNVSDGSSYGPRFKPQQSSRVRMKPIENYPYGEVSRLAIRRLLAHGFNRNSAQVRSFLRYRSQLVRNIDSRFPNSPLNHTRTPRYTLIRDIHRNIDARRELLKKNKCISNVQFNNGITGQNFSSPAGISTREFPVLAIASSPSVSLTYHVLNSISKVLINDDSENVETFSSELISTICYTQKKQNNPENSLQEQLVTSVEPMQIESIVPIAHMTIEKGVPQIPMQIENISNHFLEHNEANQSNSKIQVLKLRRTDELHLTNAAMLPLTKPAMLPLTKPAKLLITKPDKLPLTKPAKVIITKPAKLQLTKSVKLPSSSVFPLATMSSTSQHVVNSFEPLPLSMDNHHIVNAPIIAYLDTIPDHVNELMPFLNSSPQILSSWL